MQTDFMQVVAMLRRGCLVDLWDKNLLSRGNRQTEGIDKHVTCRGSPGGSGGWEQRARGQRSEVRGQVVNVTENTRAVTPSL